MTSILTLPSSLFPGKKPQTQSCKDIPLFTVRLTLRPSRLTVHPDCVDAFNDLKIKKQTTYVIYKISDDQKEIVVDETGSETDYDVFREKLLAKKDKTGKCRPSYAVYDVEFELKNGDGKRYAGDILLEFIKC